MSQIVRGTIQGTGAAFNLCLGFIPKWFKLINLEDTVELEQAVWWSPDYMKTAKGFAGMSSVFLAASITSSDLVRGAGIAPYLGGDVADGTETYIVADPLPNKVAQGTGATIDTWTLGSAANRTGNWNDVCNITAGRDKVGIGSIIKIDSGKGAVETVITAMTSNGEVANEVTLDVAQPNGRITYLGGMYTFVAAQSGIVTPKGISCAIAATINVDTEMMAFEAYRD